MKPTKTRIKLVQKSKPDRIWNDQRDVFDILRKLPKFFKQQKTS